MSTPPSVCIPYPFDSFQLKLPLAVERLSTSVSVACASCQFIISLCFLFLPTLRTHPNVLLFWNCLSDLVLSMYLIFYSRLLPVSTLVNSTTCLPHWTCLAGCFLYVFLVCCSLGWNFVIGIDLFFSLRNPFSRSKVVRVTYHIAVWGVSFVMALLATFIDREGIRFIKGKKTCFIADESSLVRLTVTFPLLVCVVVNIPLLFYIFHTLRKGLASDVSFKSRVQMLARFTIYTMLTTVFWIPPLVGQLMPIFMPETSYRRLSDFRNVYEIVMNVFESGQSFVDIAVYGSHPAILLLFYRCIKYKGVKEKVLIDDKDVEKEEPDMYIDMTEIPITDESTREEYQPPKIHRKTVIAPLSSSSIDVTLRRDVIMGLMYSMHYILRPNADLWGDIIPELFDESLYTKIDKILIQKPNNSNAGRRRYTRVFTADQPIKFYVYAPEVFKKLRESFCGGDHVFVESFPHPLPPNAFADQFSEGKSGSFFQKSLDEKFIIKSVSQYEASVLIKLLPRYFEYMTANPTTFIAKIYGLYSIKLFDGFKMTYLVMSNIFPAKKVMQIHSRFDIKGSWVNRSNRAHSILIRNPDLGTNIEEPVQSDPELGLDLDIEDPIELGDRTGYVKKQLKMDSSFLAESDIMDYSLLIGISKGYTKDEANTTGTQEIDGTLAFYSETKPEVYFLGIIDILQEYNFSKKAEKLWKHLVMRLDRDGISSQPPDFYATRFQERIDTVFS